MKGYYTNEAVLQEILPTIMFCNSISVHIGVVFALVILKTSPRIVPTNKVDEVVVCGETVKAVGLLSKLASDKVVLVIVPEDLIPEYLRIAFPFAVEV